MAPTSNCVPLEVRDGRLINYRTPLRDSTLIRQWRTSGYTVTALDGVEVLA